MRWLQQVREKVFGARAPRETYGESVDRHMREQGIMPYHTHTYQSVREDRQQEMFAPNQLPLGRILERTTPFEQARERMAAQTTPPRLREWPERTRDVGGYER